MKKIAIAALLPLFWGCQDGYDPLPPSIEGHWRRLVPANPPTEYEFRSGVMTQTTLFGSQPVAVIQRTYAVRMDTLIVGGDIGDPQRAYIMRFIGTGAAEIRSLPGDTLALGSIAYWERL